eukprot:scaffold9821_cov61-Phaeocystis_antarctica.AAC.7
MQRNIVRRDMFAIADFSRRKQCGEGRKGGVEKNEPPRAGLQNAASYRRHRFTAENKVLIACIPLKLPPSQD